MEMWDVLGGLFMGLIIGIAVGMNVGLGTKNANLGLAAGGLTLFVVWPLWAILFLS